MIPNTALYPFRIHGGEYGNLTAIEQSRDIPHPIRRVYYIYDVAEGVRRGFHAHTLLEQTLICVSGSVSIELRTPDQTETVRLDRPDQGLYIGPMVWREMYDFSPGAVLLVLASELYCAEEYLRDYDKWLQVSREYFSRHPNGEYPREHQETEQR